ncbi:MAG: DUF2130 domain-containing protein [Solirubrobacterales bacterium]
MEASEKQQLPLDEGSVRALEDRLVIENLTVSDDRAARVVRERAEAGQSPPRTVADAIEIGARVLDREDAAAEVDYVRAEFERHAAELRERLTRALADGDEALSERIAASFDGSREGSVQQQIREVLARALEEQRTAITRQFSTEDGTNPLADFKGGIVTALRQSDARQQKENEENRKRIEALTRELVELKERAEGDRRVAEAEEAGTRKGRSFEERVHLALDRLATARGDCAHHVGDEPGIGGTKKGDTVVEVGAAEGPTVGRIVFEDKDDQLSKNKAWAELNAAMGERQADFAVLVVAGDENVPAGREQLAEYEGNKMIVAVDPDEPDELGLDLAYRYARLRLVLKREGELTLDAAGVRDAAEEARSALRSAQAIRLALTNADKSVSKARDGVDELVASVDAQLERIESLVDAADQAE